MNRIKKVIVVSILSVAVIGGGALIFDIGVRDAKLAGLNLMSEAIAGHRDGDHHGRRHGMRALCSEKRTERIDMALEVVESFTTFSTEQESAWNELVVAVNDSDKVIESRCVVLMEEGRPDSLPGWMDRADTMLVVASEIMEKIHPALDSFYATLDDDQKAALDNFLR